MNYRGTHDLLERELRHLGAKAVVLRMAIDPSWIRHDGQMYSNARPDHPGVILQFDSAQGPLSFPCDTFDDWLANLHAIAVVLEDLRRMNRYGVGRTGGQQAQYRGWQQLPAPPSVGFASVEEAYEFLQKLLGWGDVHEVERMLREAEMKTHPDRGGDADSFKQVQLARALLLPKP